MIEYLPLVLTGLGIIVSILYYTSVLRNTNKTRQAQLYMHFASQMTSESWAEHMWNVMNANCSNLEEFQKWYNESHKNQISWSISINYFENAGVLVRSELLDIDMVAVGFAGITRKAWEKMKPVILEQRGAWNQPRLASEFEYLYDRLMKHMEEHPELAT